MHDLTVPYGLDVDQTVPWNRWQRRKQQTLDNTILRSALRERVHAFDIPELGNTLARYQTYLAWVAENNPKAKVTEPYNQEYPPRGDPNCRLGVKRKTNQ